MRLTKVRIRNFKHVLDSTEVEIQPDITCFVGKNESGKTAFLEALRRLRPAQGNARFNIAQHYPAWLEKQHRRQGITLEHEQPVTAVFELEEEDRRAISDVFGPDVLISDEIILSRQYDNNLLYRCDIDETRAVINFLDGLGLAKVADVVTKNARTFAQLVQEANKLASNAEHDEQVRTAGKLIRSKVIAVLGDKMDFQMRVWNILRNRIPQFFYYSEYSCLPGVVDIRALLEADRDSLDVNDLTALSLLHMAGADDDYLLNPDYEMRKRELENVANAISQDVLAYWSTNADLRVLIDINRRNERRHGVQTDVVEELHMRLYDNQRMLSLPFNERSSGFQWFFSFLVAFSRYEYDKTPIILLLDEPGLGLHARAQRDFLRFIEERLARRCQVIYSTHSPYMIQADHLERVRIVEDKRAGVGSVVTSDMTRVAQDTLVPIQGALGTAFLGRVMTTANRLLVESPAAVIYLSSLSSFLASKGRTGLDPRWTLVPVNGAMGMAAFSILMDGALPATLLLGERSALAVFQEKGLLNDTNIVTLGEIEDRRTLRTIEDVFSVADYLTLYNDTFSASVGMSELNLDQGGVLAALAHYNKGRAVDTERVADHFLKNRTSCAEVFSEETLDNFEMLFLRLNSLVEKGA